jgi:hypothetical protein
VADFDSGILTRIAALPLANPAGPTWLNLLPSLMAGRFCGDFCGDERTRTADSLLAKHALREALTCGFADDAGPENAE